MAQIWDFRSLLWFHYAFIVGATELKIWCHLSWFCYSWCRDQIHQNFRFILQIFDGGFPLLWRHTAIWLQTSWFLVGTGVRSSELIKYSHRVDNRQIRIRGLCQRNLRLLLLHQFQFGFCLLMFSLKIGQFDFQINDLSTILLCFSSFPDILRSTTILAWKALIAVWYQWQLIFIQWSFFFVFDCAPLILIFIDGPRFTTLPHGEPPSFDVLLAQIMIQFG